MPSQTFPSQTRASPGRQRAGSGFQAWHCHGTTRQEGRVLQPSPGCQFHALSGGRDGDQLGWRGGGRTGRIQAARLRLPAC
eukprot:8376798-Pyramimonas_sp.AAC.1